jgi:SHS2 domain-containing protein
MPYKFLDDIAIADIAFEAWGDTLEEMFASAADATMNVMVSDIDGIERKENRTIALKAERMDMLLFDFLQELIFFKDAEMLLLRVENVKIGHNDKFHFVSADAYGEKIDPEKHDLIVDVKAVTLHRFKVEQSERGWHTVVVLDI